jgi:hypothetical protein
MEGIGIGTRTGTGETGTRGIPGVAMSENDETQVGGMGKRTGIDTTRTRGKATRVGMQSVMTRKAASGKHGWIRSLRIRRNLLHNRKVHTYIRPFDLSTDRYIDTIWSRPSIAQSSTPASQKVDHAQTDPGEPEEGEAMEAVNDDDEAMMAMMGMTGFGSTKVRVPL